MGQEIITNRVILRNFRNEDLEDFYEYCSQEGVGEAAGWAHHVNVEDSREVLEKFIKDENKYAIVYKENNKVIGHIGVNEDSEDGKPDTKELGYALNKNYWRRGIMYEVVNAILDYTFSKDINNIYACCFKDNIASKSLIEKCGFKLECEGEFYSPKLNRLFESYEYLYKKEDWHKFTNR